MHKPATVGGFFLCIKFVILSVDEIVQGCHMKIRKAVKDDIEFMYHMSEFEQWGNTLADYKRLYDLEPDGCFITEEGKQPIGMITSISQGDYGFLASLIVKKEARGKGIGEKLLLTAIDYLHSKKVSTIELDGVIKATPLYRRLGFRDKYMSLRLVRAKSKKGDKQVGKIKSEVCIDDVRAIDNRMTGLKRGRVLQRLYSEFPDNVVTITQKSKLCGYGFVRPNGESGYSIGPIIAETSDIFAEILNRIIHRFSHYDLKIGVPELNKQAISILHDNGFENLDPSLRMYLGPRIDYESHVYAITSPEKG